MTRTVSTLLIAAGLLWEPALAGAAAVDRLRYVGTIYADDKDVGMQQPEGVACQDASTLIVADTGRGRLLRYSVDARTVKPAGQITAPQMASPLRVEVNSKGDLFVLDGKQRRILRFSSAGEFKGYLTPEGVPAPTSIVPRSLKIDRSDNIYVLDVFSARVLVLDPAGKYVRHVPFPPSYGFFSDLAVDGRGVIYLLDSVDAAVYATAKDAKEFSAVAKDLHAHLSFPTSLIVDSRGILFIVDQNGSAIVLLGQDGSVLARQLAMGWTEGLLYYPAQVCLNDRGQLFVADRGNDRVQVFAIVQ